MQSSTGQNDPGTVWGQFSDIIKTGATIYGDIRSGGKATKPAPAAATAPAAGPNWMPWAIGGAVLLVVGVFAFRR